MTLALMPSRAEMVRAYQARDAQFDGLFFIAVKTTGIFCRPTCPARSPRPENVEFFASAVAAQGAGYRACLRCRPLEPRGAVPPWAKPLLAALEAEPEQRLDDADLRARGIEPARARRWFKAHYGMTFQAYQRARRLSRAQARLGGGGDIADTAFDSGFESLSGFREAFRRQFGAAPGAARGREVITVTRVLTPLGPMIAGATQTGICLFEFAEPGRLWREVERLRVLSGCPVVPGETPLLQTFAAEMEAYFAGRLQDFSVPVALFGSEFQRTVWTGLRAIPFGTTRSYAELAAAIGRPGAQRAVGLANGQNRIAILVPCHRVIGADGSLTGYGGGLWRKRHLLALEQGPLTGP